MRARKASLTAIQLPVVKNFHQVVRLLDGAVIETTEALRSVEDASMVVQLSGIDENVQVDLPIVSPQRLVFLEILVSWKEDAPVLSQAVLIFITRCLVEVISNMVLLVRKSCDMVLSVRKGCALVLLAMRVRWKMVKVERVLCKA